MEFLNDHHSTLIEVFDDTTVCKIKFSQDSLQSHKKHTAYDSAACRTTFSSNNLKFFMTLTVSYIIIYNIDLVHGGFEKLVDIWALTGSLQDLDCSLFQPFCWRFDVMIGIIVLVASPNAGQAESFEQLASNWFLVHGQLQGTQITSWGPLLFRKKRFSPSNPSKHNIYLLKACIVWDVAEMLMLYLFKNISIKIS